MSEISQETKNKPDSVKFWALLKMIVTVEPNQQKLKTIWQAECHDFF